MTIKINGDNSVANPGFTGADTDTGLQVGTNELKLVTNGTAKATVDANGTAKFTGANAPSGLDTRITQYGSLLVGTDSDTVSAARCSIDAGNGNISSNGTGTFNGVVKADRSAAGDGCFHAALSGTVKAAINSNGTGYFLGSLGAGTSIPATKLHVDGGSTGSAVTIDNGGYGTMRMGAAANGSNLISVGTGEKLVFGHQSAAGTSYTERMRMLTTGGLTFNGDTAQANALDDYEEGTWTPSIGGNATYTAQEGNYIKIGHLVLAHFRVGINAQGTGNTSGSISGLPFNSAKAAQNTASLTFGSLGVNIAWGVYYVGANSSTLYFSYTAGAAAGVSNNPNILTNGASINGTLMYIST